MVAASRCNYLRRAAASKAPKRAWNTKQHDAPGNFYTRSPGLPAVLCGSPEAHPCLPELQSAAGGVEPLGRRLQRAARATRTVDAHQLRLDAVPDHGFRLGAGSTNTARTRHWRQLQSVKRGRLSVRVLAQPCHCTVASTRLPPSVTRRQIVTYVTFSGFGDAGLCGNFCPGRLYVPLTRILNSHRVN